MERLRLENDELREKLASTKDNTIEFDPTLIGPTDAVDVEYSVVHGNTVNNYQLKLDLGGLFLIGYQRLRVETGEGTISAHIAAVLHRRQGSHAHENAVYALSRKSLSMLRMQFEALELVQISQSRPGTGILALHNEYTWEATIKGKRYAAMKLAMKKPDPS